MNKNLVAIRLKNNPTPCEADRQKNFEISAFLHENLRLFPRRREGDVSPVPFPHRY